MTDIIVVLGPDPGLDTPCGTVRAGDRIVDGSSVGRMASRDIVVRVGEDDWLALDDAAECAGMSVEAYVCWGVRLLALQARPGGAKREAGVRWTEPPERRASDRPEESESLCGPNASRSACRVAPTDGSGHRAVAVAPPADAGGACCDQLW
ncbi:hypothetical protein [Nocardia sp. NPDC051981]|uniref:hypothetical protein n=1 Tax=Nocardia sp. NPDC051981 TaxID=3155417 RepID=UPI003423CEC0